MLSALDSEDVVCQVIERAILERRLGPGQRLPTERELAQTSGVGRTAVRRALSYLEAEGRLVRQVGRGTFIAPSTRPALPSSGDTFETSPIEIMTVRALFEPELMPIIVMAATSTDFTEMERCLDGGDTAIDYLAWEAWDTALHRSLAMATHNGFLIRIGEMIAAARSQPVWGGLKYRSSTEDHRDQYRSDHRAIVRALAERDATKAQLAMRRHLQRVRVHLLGEHSRNIDSGEEPALIAAPPHR